MLGTAGFGNWERRTWWERSLHGTVGESKAQDGQEDLCFSTAHAEEAAYSAGLSTGYQREELRKREGKKCAHIGPRIVNVGWGGAHCVCGVCCSFVLDSFQNHEDFRILEDCN